MKKYHFTFDKTKKNEKFNKVLLSKFKNYSPKTSDIIVVLGGDGFMLQTLKRYQKYNKPFYGINRGTFGFLMNKFKTLDISNSITKAKMVTIFPLEMKATTKNGKTFSSIAINEVSLLRQTRQTAILQILNNKNFLIKKLICDGVLVSTSAGSTAYNLSVGGPILSLNSKKLAITPISPFRPRRWKGKTVSLKSTLEIINFNIQKRPISAVADNYEVRNVKKVVIKMNKSIKFKLLFDEKNSLNKKIKIEKIRKR